MQSVFKQTKKFPGRWVLGACFTLLTFSSGLGFYGLAVYLQAFSSERQWSVSSISLATTLFFLVGGISGVWIAKFIAKHDVRIMVLGGACLATIALFSMRFVEHRWQLFAVYIFYALGWSASGMGPITTVVTRWFHVRRAGALAIASTGLSMGGIVVTPFIKWILDSQGIHNGSPWLALIWFCGTVPVTLFLLRAFPQPYGWLPDGERAEPGQVGDISGTPLNEAVRTKFFRAVAIGYIFALGAQVGGALQLVKLVEERTDRSTATLATIILSSMSIISRFVAGRIIPRVDMTKFTVGLAIVQGLSLASMALNESRIGLLLSIALFGVTIGNMVMMQSLLIAERFGVRDYPRIAARSGLISFSGTALGPLLLGWLYDVAGGYRSSYLAAAACSLIGATMFSFAGSASEQDIKSEVISS
ncbi:MAG: MFS transporter [Actinobacteria bacterium]|nr:MFS transporter [Actinomycetota bacterium]